MDLRGETKVGPVRSPRSYPREEEVCPLCRQTLPHHLTLAELQARLEEQRREAAKAEEKRLRAWFSQELEKTKQQEALAAAGREKKVRAEAEVQARESLKKELSKLEEGRAKAEAAKKVAEERMGRLEAEQKVRTDQEVKKALQEQRTALEEDALKRVQKVQAAEFEKSQKLQRQLERAQRQLEEKTAGELGEGAEVDLYETLREAFEGDRIRRVKKGEAGADVVHVVHHNGQDCGTIVYDSKNHQGWRDSFTAKLRADQLAAKADHAVLTTSAFPSQTRQLVVRNDVIVINPARAIELVRILRRHMIQLHRLRLSAEQRNRKTQELYELITSERWHQLIERQSAIADDLLELEEKELKAHERTWKTRGKMLRDLQKAQADVGAEIDRILEGEGEA